MKKITNYRNQPQMDDLNRLHSAVQDLIDSGAQGEKGEKGDDGDNGWTPVLALIEREDDIVVQIADYVGGTGNKPSQSIGLYVGATGLVPDILDAVNVRGLQGLRGEAGLDGDNGEGVPTGGTTGQVLTKASDDSFDTEWTEASGGGGGASTFVELTDTPSSLGDVGQVLGINIDFSSNKFLQWQDPPASVESILDLDDTPSDYGYNGQVLRLVNNFGSYYMEWADQPEAVESFTALNDSPPDYSGQSGKIIAVNAAEDALEFIDAPSGGGGGGSTQSFGTFTPTLVSDNGGTPSSATASGAKGTYIRNGDSVTVSGRIRWKNGAAVDEQVRIAGLPFEVERGYYHASIGGYANSAMPDIDRSGNSISAVYGYMNAYTGQIWVVGNLGTVAALSTVDSTRYGLTFSATYQIKQ